MPKRKWEQYGREQLSLTQKLELKKVEFAKSLIQGKKVLHRALKTAKGFERQKLGRRIKLAVEKQDASEAGRLQRELDVLKILDLHVVVDSHLYKTLLKSKSISESGFLPENVTAETKWKRGPPEELLAIGNVTARLYNTKPVKEAMAHIMSLINAILGIPNTPAAASAMITNKTPRTSILGHNSGEAPKSEDSRPDTNSNKISREHATAESPGDDENALGLRQEEPNFDIQLDVESEDPSRCDALFGVLSDEESTGHSNPSTEISQRPGDTSSQQSLSSRSASPLPKSRESAKQSQSGTSRPRSAFLPTLMGGYWSGSESATDEENNSTQKKNRPGQQARRALWEKKFGSKANHLKGSASRKDKDKDWDPRRGARRENETRFRGRTGGRGIKSFSMNRNVFTGENAVVVTPRPRGIGKKDDTGQLHPSWEAAKKAKEAKQTVSFQGKKVVFE